MEEDLNSIFDENQETNDETNTCLNRNRVILHFDIDCFYAQVSKYFLSVGATVQFKCK